MHSGVHSRGLKRTALSFLAAVILLVAGIAFGLLTHPASSAPLQQVCPPPPGGMNSGCESLPCTLAGEDLTLAECNGETVPGRRWCTPGFHACLLRPLQARSASSISATKNKRAWRKVSRQTTSLRSSA